MAFRSTEDVNTENMFAE